MGDSDSIKGALQLSSEIPEKTACDPENMPASGCHSGWLIFLQYCQSKMAGNAGEKMQGSFKQTRAV